MTTLATVFEARLLVTWHCASASGCFVVGSPPAAVVPVGAVTGVSVISEVEADGRGLASYSVRFQIQNALKLTVRELDTSTEPKTTENITGTVRRVHHRFVGESGGQGQGYYGTQ